MGTFTANFGAGELTGLIQNAAHKIDLGTADIFGSAIAGLGTATATNPSTTATLASNGDVSGQFFGSAAQALAGIVSFSSNQYDTAFGGENCSILNDFGRNHTPHRLRPFPLLQPHPLVSAPRQTDTAPERARASPHVHTPPPPE